MAPELIKFQDKKMEEYNPEKCDIFSLGITFLRLILNLKE